MAKKRKSRKSKNKSLNKRLELNEGVANEILAVILIIIAIVVSIGFLSADGGLLNQAFRFLVGGAIYLLPALLVLAALRIFLHEEHKLPFSVTFGSILAISMLAGMVHVDTYLQEDALNQASQGAGGGMVGHLVDLAIVGLFAETAGMVVLTGLFLVGLIVTFNVRLSQIFAWLKSLVSIVPSGEGKAREKSESIMQPVSKSAPKLNTGVQLEQSESKRSTLKNSSEVLSSKDDHEALTTTVDPEWNFPDTKLLDDSVEKADAGDWKSNAEIIQETLSDFKIDVQMEDINVGPRVTQYTLKPPSGVRLSKITALEQNIALNLAAHSIRIEAPIPGKRAVGIEVPNKKSAMVRMRPILESKYWGKSKSKLSFALGKDIAGIPIVTALDEMPHLLVAGATGTGKSVMINTFLTSLLYRNSPSDLKLILIDPKQVELGLYNDIPHLLTPVITHPEKCISALKWSVAEMERRLSQFREAGKRNIAEYNAINKNEPMPSIVIVIDELADLMMMAARDVESLVVRLAQKARATGIHLVLATQRPSVDVITGLIKANVPARVAFTVPQQVDSRTIIDQGGAEKLLGSGDMLFMSPKLTKPVRIQGVLIEEKEVKLVTDHLRMERAPQYNDEITSQPVEIGKGGVVVDADSAEDSMFEDAVKVVVDSGKASSSLLQRRLRVGYARAARLIEAMEEQGIVGPADGARPREVLIGSADDVFGGESVDSISSE